MVRRSAHAPRSEKRGFQIIEVLVAMALLGIAATGLIGMEGTAITGVTVSGDLSKAVDLAEQQADALVAQGVNAVPGGCLVAVAAAETGCQADAQTMAPNIGCTVFADGAIVAQPDGTSLYNTANPQLHYRIDSLFVAHPSPDQTGGVAAIVSVCWTDMTGQIRQVQARRYLTP